MALFKRRSEAAPAWSPFADAEDWQAFAELARAEAKARGWRLDLDEGLAHDGTTRYTLANVAQACRTQPRDAWAAQVHDHFDVVAGIDSERRFGGPEEARAAMKARLVDDGFFAQADFEPVWLRVADDLRLALAFDLPQSVVIADRAEVLEWGDEDALFALALENARAEQGLELERHPLDDDAPRGRARSATACIGCATAASRGWRCGSTAPSSTSPPRRSSGRRWSAGTSGPPGTSRA